jgi:hypothetical protein
MLYKRATRALREAGIDHILIVKRLWGAAPEDPRLARQTSQCFATWQEAVEAVKAGFRPHEGSSVINSTTYRRATTSPLPRGSASPERRPMPTDLQPRYRISLAIQEYYGPAKGYRRHSVWYLSDSLPDICALRQSPRIWDVAICDLTTGHYLY